MKALLWVGQKVVFCTEMGVIWCDFHRKKQASHPKNIVKKVAQTEWNMATHDTRWQWVAYLAPGLKKVKNLSGDSSNKNKTFHGSRDMMR